MDRRALIERIACTWAMNAAAHARVLATQDPSWGTEVFDLGGGQAVLCGPGLYVNRALAMGLSQPATADDFDLLEERSEAVGVEPSVDVVPTADRSVTEIAGARGYAVLRFLTTHQRPLGDDVGAGPSDLSITIEPAGGQLFDVWKEVAAEGFGAVESEARRASDAFAKAAAAVDEDGLLIARDAEDGRPLGCGTVTIRDGLATLPSERRRGVQAALISHRLRIAVDAGCDLAVSSSVPANTSERNLARAGFRPLYETVTLSKGPRGIGSS
jgi:GNAT superfamily N-acetyltransferase